MSPRFAAAFILAAALFARAADAADDAPAAARIEQAIRDLGANEFAVRTQATEFLWRIGQPAQSALEAAAKSEDSEVSFRARSILEKFKYGIYPDTPVDVVRLINQYRLGDKNIKHAALRQLQSRGDTRTLLVLLKVEPDEELRRQLQRQFFANPTEIVWQLLLDGDRAQAEEVLVVAATGFEGMRHYAAYLFLAGGIDEKVAQLRDLKAAEENSTHKTLLVHLLRAKGDLRGALALADEMGDEMLTRGLAFELGDWRRLMELLPDDVIGREPKETEDPFAQSMASDIELLGFAAAYFRLAGNSEAYDKAVAAIQQFAAADKSTVRRHASECAAALILNDRPEEGIEQMARARPTDGFRLLVAQLRYREALKLAGIENPQGPYDKWFQSVAQEVKDNPKESEARFQLAVHVASLLARNGESEPAVESFAALANAVKVDEDARRLIEIVEAERRAGLKTQAIEHASVALAKKDGSAVLAELFPSQNELATFWWNHFSQARAGGAVNVTLQRIEQLLDPRANEGEGKLDIAEVIGQARGATTELDDEKRGAWLHSLGETCRLHKQMELARTVLEEAAGAGHAPSMLALGDIYAADEAWPLAARWYAQAFDRDKRRPLALYLAGHALKTAGQVAEGQKRMDMAVLLPLADASVRRDLANGLKTRGLADAAVEQLQLALRTCAFQEGAALNASQDLGNLVVENQPLLAAQSWEYLMLNVLGPVSFRGVEANLLLPYLVHKARGQGLLQQGDVDGAVREFWLSHAASPGNVQLAEDIVPKLDAADRREVADQLFDKIYQRSQQAIEVFPNSASLHNNIAWTAARCDRRLEDALRLAKRAVELEPESAAYIDTLAEAHFRLGQRDEAIRHAKRCLEIEPDNDHFQKQLKRFETNGASDD